MSHVPYRSQAGARTGQRESLPRRLDDPGRGPEGQAGVPLPERDPRAVRRRRPRNPRRAAGRRTRQPLLARPDPEPDRQHGRGRRSRATPRSWRSSASATRLNCGRPTRSPCRSASPTRSSCRPPRASPWPCPTRPTFTISGADKQKVGQFAAEIRKARPPEPYKGKGIRYEGEAIRRKSGKAFGSK